MLREGKGSVYGEQQFVERPGCKTTKSLISESVIFHECREQNIFHSALFTRQEANCLIPAGTIHHSCQHHFLVFGKGVTLSLGSQGKAFTFLA